MGGTTDAAIAANTADIAVLAAWSGDTTADIAANTADIAALGAISGITLVSITGVTNGLTKVGSHDSKLGETETTTLFGSEILNINVNKLNLTGATSGVTISGDVFVRDLIGVNDLVCVNATTGQLGTTSLSAFGGITGGTNGIVVCDFQRLGLGGALCADTSICGAGNDLSLGTAGSKLDLLNVHTSGNVGITSDANLVMSLSGGTITTSDLKVYVIQQIIVQHLLTFSYNKFMLVQQFYSHTAVLVATTGNTDLSGDEIIDGIDLNDGDRVLVKNRQQHHKTVYC